MVGDFTIPWEGVFFIMDKFHTHWDKLRIFHQVALVGSLKAAADVLNISQPALSRSISLLEEYLDMQLFERRSRGLGLTRQGEIIFQATQKIVDELSHAQVQLEEEETEPVGSITIGAPTGVASLYIAAMIPDFLKLYPRINISIDGSDILPDIRNGEADVIISPRLDDDDQLVQTFINRFHMKLYASPEYLEEFGVPKSVSDLNQHRILGYGSNETSHPFNLANWHLGVGLKKGEVRQPHATVNSASGLINLAIRGVGIISLSDDHPSLPATNLVEILPEIMSPPLDAYFIYSASTKKLRRMNLLEDFLLQTFRNRLDQRNVATIR